MWKSTSVSGAPDNSSLSHFSAMTRPSWLGRAARNRHRHAIEQASRRWRGGRRDDSARTRRKILVSTQVTKLAEACPSKTPKTYLHPNEHFMPLDEEMWRMRRMQDVINDQAKKHKKQPVQFVDPMQSAYFGDDEDFEPDEL